MKFSIWPDNERPWSETLELATWCAASGFDGFWFADHFMEHTDDDSAGAGPALECWTVLTALGALVPRVRLVSMVSPVTIHHPVVLAKRVTTLDAIAPGRVVLGLGAGWQVNEHAAYGFELPEPGPRVTRFEEAIEVIRNLLDDDRANFSGGHYHLTDAPFAPKPSGQLPLLVGTGSPRMMRVTARFADEWNTWGDPEQVATRTKMFERECEHVGRDPATVHRSAQAMIFLTTDDAARDKMKSRAPAGRSLVGNTTELVDLIGGYVDLGVDEFALKFALPDFTLGKTAEARRDAFATLHAEVVSVFS